MPLKVKNIIDCLENLAPPSYAEKWDNVGLMTGNAENDVKTVMLSLDVTPDVVEQAIKQKAQMIVSHHPLIFSPLKTLAETSWQSRMLADIIRADITVYSAHTNLDSAVGGVNDVLAEKLGLMDVSILDTSNVEPLCKIVVFVPEGYADKVRTAMTNAGAGHIGEYKDCTFMTDGTGTFRPLEGTKPFIGRIGRLEKVKEVRLETIIMEKDEKKVLTAMIKAHPYEEVAYDIYPLRNRLVLAGLGRVGVLKQLLTAKQLAEKVKKALKADAVTYSDAGRKIKKVAVCGGAGTDFIDTAIRQGADAFVTGDVKYHAAQKALLDGMTLIDAGHQATEMPVLGKLQELLQDIKGLKIIIAREKIVIRQLQEEL